MFHWREKTNNNQNMPNNNVTERHLKLTETPYWNSYQHI